MGIGSGSRQEKKKSKTRGGLNHLALDSPPSTGIAFSSPTQVVLGSKLTMNPGSTTTGAKMADVLHRSLVGGIVILSGYLVVSNLVMGTNFYKLHKEGQVRVHQNSLLSLLSLKLRSFGSPVDFSH